MFCVKKNIFKTVIYLSFIFLAFNLFYLQVINYPIHKQRSLENIIRIIPLEASRGIIYDRNDKILVDNRISFDLAIIPQEVDNIGKTLTALSKLCGISKKRLYKNYKRNYTTPFIPVVVAQDLDKRKAFFIDENTTSVPGAILWSNPRRNYRDPQAISHITGHIGKIGEAEYKILRGYGYRIREYVGKSGIEKYYNSYLRGEDDGVPVEVDSASCRVRQLGYKSPKKGKDIFLTIDIDLQRIVNLLLREETGVCIVMDVRTGEILVLASSPNFDPNIFVDPTKQRQRLALLRQKDYPMLNRAISSAYPPGSTFKIVVATAALCSGKIKKDTSFYCSGTYNLGKAKFSCWKKKGHGSQNIIQGLTHSCNIFFYNAGKVIGPNLIHRYSIRFGLSQPTGIDLPGEVSGLVPSPLWKRLNKNESWYLGDTFNFAIGQGYLLITPIQALKMITLIANKGFTPRPFLARRIGKLNLEGNKVNRTVITEERNEFDTIQQALFNVVNDSTGTGQRVRVKGLKICGKTGTAQVPKAETHAWFAGYAPYDNPKFLLLYF